MGQRTAPEGTIGGAVGTGGHRVILLPTPRGPPNRCS
jgi:hypothetical protein